MRLGPGDLARVVADRLALAATGAGREIVRAGSATTRAVALSFDDGPSLSNTPVVLDLLESVGARATFFVVGEFMRGREAVLERAVAHGHELGNHTFTHPKTAHLTRDELYEEISRTNAAIESVGGRPRLLRPPFGKDRRRFVQFARELGMVVALWSIDSGDTRGATGDEIASALIRDTTPGSIVLLHDGGDLRADTLAACGTYVPAIVADGFRLVTISELLVPTAATAASPN